MLPVRITPVDSLLLATDLVAIGSFRCPATHRLYRDSGPIGSHLFAFPRTSTVIRHSGGRPFLADPNLATLYNAGQEYERSRASDLDASDWYSVSPELLVEAVSEYDPGIRDRADRPFRFPYAPVSSALYARQRRLFEHAAAGETPDRLAAEESVMSLLHEVIRSSYQSVTAATRHKNLREPVEATRRLLAAHLAHPLSLGDIARAVDCSPFALCRAFHATTGKTITAYRNTLRMHTALALLRGPEDLTTIALDLGYSSHSHFTMIFRRTFGQTPSQYRRQRPLAMPRDSGL